MFLVMKNSGNTQMNLNIKYIVVCFIAFCLTLLNTSVQAQDYNFTASISKASVAINEQFQVSYKMEGNGSNFQPPRLDDFRILSGPNQSTSMQFINGNMSQSVSYSFILQATREGNFKLPPASIEAGGKRINSNSLSVTVTAATTQQPQAGAQGGTRGNDQSADGDLGKQIADNVFMRITADKTNVYRGEPVVVSFKLYTRLNLVNYGVTRIPALTGFWVQDISLPQQLQFTNESLNGIIYRVAEVKKSVLFPQQTGTITIEPMETEAIVRVQARRSASGNSIFDQFFNDPIFGGYQDYKQKLSTSPMKITVRDLPEAGKPANYAGAVGKYTMTASMEPAKVEANEPVTLKITISGKGNLKLLEGPKPIIPNSLETYDPKISESINANAGGVSGSKSFEYLIIPRTPGTFTIDPLAFSFFDLDKKQYVTLRAGPFEIEAMKGSGSAPTVIGGGTSKADFNLLGKDIMFIKTAPTRFRGGGDHVFGSWYFYCLSALPLLLIAGLMVHRRRQSAMMHDAAGTRVRQATSLAKKRMAIARNHIKANARDKFYEETLNALWGYLSYKLGIPVADLSKSSAELELQSKQVSDETIQSMMAQINKCEFARYAPVADSSDVQSVYDEAIGVISKLEREIQS